MKSIPEFENDILIINDLATDMSDELSGINMTELRAVPYFYAHTSMTSMFRFDLNPIRCVYDTYHYLGSSDIPKAENGNYGFIYLEMRLNRNKNYAKSIPFLGVDKSLRSYYNPFYESLSEMINRIESETDLYLMNKKISYVWQERGLRDLAFNHVIKNADSVSELEIPKVGVFSPLRKLGAKIVKNTNDFNLIQITLKLVPKLSKWPVEKKTKQTFRTAFT